MRKLTGLWALLVVLLVLGACGGNKSKQDSDGTDDDKWSARNVKREDTSNRNSDGSGKSGNNGNAANAGGGNTGKQPEPEPEPEPQPIEKPLARTDIEGKVTEFNNVIALWDEANHAVRFVASTQPIPEDQLARLRNGEPLEGEVPHFVMSFVLNEGTTKMDKGKVENWFYDFHWLTSLSPMSLRNIGRETIKEMTGNAKVGETLRLVIDFKSENVKDAPEEKIHFDVQFEIKLQ